MAREAPTIQVSVTPQGGGSAGRVDLSSRVISLTYEDDEKQADKCSLVVDNYQLENFDDPIWRKGNLLSVSWGYPGNMAPTRNCIIQIVKGARQLKVEALAKSIAMHKTTESRTFRDTTRAAVVSQIAQLNGYGPDRQHIEDDGVTHDTVVQARETDAAFLQRLAGREGFVFFVDFDGLHWHRRKLGQAPIRTLTWADDPGEGDIVDFDVLNDVTAKPASITLAGRDPINKKDIRVTGDNSSTSRSGIAPVLEIVDPRTGATTRQANTGQAIVAHTTETNPAAAQRHADGAYRNSVLLTVELSLKLIGDPSMLAKSIVNVAGLRSLSGKYYVTKTKHTVGPGYQMEAWVKRDGRSTLQGGAPSDAKQNSKAPADPKALSPKEVVDPRTGQTRVQYVDARGRSQSEADK